MDQGTPRDRLSPFATASLGALLAAAMVPLVVRTVWDLQGPLDDPDGRGGFPYSLAVAAGAFAAAGLLTVLFTGLLYRFRTGLPLPELRGAAGLAPVQGKWFVPFLIGALLAGAAYAAGPANAATVVVLWLMLMVPVCVVAALSNGGDL